MILRRLLLEVEVVAGRWPAPVRKVEKQFFFDGDETCRLLTVPAGRVQGFGMDWMEGM